MKKGGVRGRKHKRQTEKKHKRQRRSHQTRKYRYRGRGGYNQFGSNVPFGPTYEVPGSSLVPSLSALANPPPITRTNHAVDNYNHFTGKGFASPILDQDVV